ncbi:MAG: XdhC family protein [Rhodospirillales bacterium]
MDASDADVLREALAWHEAGRRVALATVIATWGSAPRPVGSRLAVDDGGRFAGSVSGGCVEAAVVDAAQAVIAAGRPRRVVFTVSKERAWDVGLACGGRIEILVEPLT